MVLCEICFELFPANCFEYLKCNHKICFFCYEKIIISNNISCPFCRQIIEIEYNNDLDYNEYYFDYNELIQENNIRIKNKKGKKNKKM